MIDQATLLTYAAIVAGFVFIPGPATILAMARASGSGIRAGIATAGGIAVGDMLHTTFAVIGLSAVVLASATLFTLIKYAGAAYLIYLGLRAIWTARAASAFDVPPDLSPRHAFRQAIVAEVLNPKTALFFVAFLPQFVDPSKGFVPVQLAVFGAVLVALGFASTVTYALAAGRLGKALRENARLRLWQDRCVGGIYCALGLRIALQER